jgi:hypothetical protein
MQESTKTQFPEVFERARQEFVGAQAAANAVRTPCLSLYLYHGPTNVEQYSDTSFFEFMYAYPSQEIAVAATKTQRVSGTIEPWWFIIPEELAADGKRYADGHPVYEHTFDCTHCVRDGIFNTYLSDDWIPFACAGGGYRRTLFIIFKGALPASWNEVEAKEECIEWRIDD